jgi:ferric-dicitrate binding protein FerR (iron transport regulator)
MMYRAVVGVVACTLAVFAGWRLHESNGDRSDATLWSTYSTANGQRATITLPDGSIVALNVGSRIQVPTDYASGNRALHLTGEALFTVVPSDASPFTVVAGPSTTRVLGTSFLVRHYPTDTVATIAVQHGKVMVDSTVVVAAQQLSVGWNSRSVVRPVNASPFSFVAGVLTFDETPLGEAIPVLSRWYDIEIRLADSSLATRRITGDFGAGSSAHFTSIVLGAFNDIGVTQDGRILTLYQR